MDDAQEKQFRAFTEYLIDRYKDGKLPLFVVGSGASVGVVPMLNQMTRWLAAAVEVSVLDPNLKDSLRKHGTAIINGTALRADAASFFSALQLLDVDPDLRNIWTEFSNRLLDKGFSDFGTKGLRHLGQTDVPVIHQILALLLSKGLANIISLNYDPLFSIALTKVLASRPPEERSYVLLYSSTDIIRYFCNRPLYPQLPQPAIVNARGDIFLATCTNAICPQRDTGHIVDYPNLRTMEDAFVCPSCHSPSLRLQLSFPGSQLKELIIDELISHLRPLIGTQTSAVVFVGVSGTWDPFLITDMFQWAYEYSIPVADVRPRISSPSNKFERVAHRMFRELCCEYVPGECCYVPIKIDAEEFGSSVEQQFRSHKLISNDDLKAPQLRLFGVNQ